MGKIRKVGDIYYIEFIARGLMYTQPAGPTEEDAQKLLQEVEGKIAQGEALTIVREIDLGIFFEQYLASAKEQFSPKSLQRFLQFWQHLSNFLSTNYPNVTKLSNITPSVIESYKAYLVKNSKPKVVNLTILLLREVLEYGIKIGFINDNPSLHISLLQLPLKPTRSGKRTAMAKDLLQRGIPLGKVYQLLKLSDVAQVMYWSDFIPLKREDAYK